MDIQNLLIGSGLVVRENIPLDGYVTLGVAGTARLLVEVETREKLLAAWQVVTASGRPVVVLGGGSNVVFSAPVLEAVLLVNRSGGLALEGELLRVGSGVSIGSLLAYARENGRGGLEFLAGIPGTAGGSAAVNAGAFGCCLADCLVQAEVLTASGKVVVVQPDYFGFSYRDSALKYGNDIILTLWLKTRVEKTERIAGTIREHIAYRRDHHPPYPQRSAGCFFKNPLLENKKVSAGKLLQECGLLGRRFGPLRLAEQHANFLLNDAGAMFPELEKAEREIVAAVERRTGLRLQREVIYIDALGRKF